LRREGAKPDMNVTPLVDVVLVLLIIFMVIAPQLEGGPAIDTPGIFHPDPKTDARKEPVIVGLTSDGILVLDKTPMSRADLLARLHEVHAAEPDRRVILKADRMARYGDVRGLFKECREIGFPGVSLQVGDRKKDDAPGSPAMPAAPGSAAAAVAGPAGASAGGR
jgi:biopolymer transport protein TolR